MKNPMEMKRGGVIGRIASITPPRFYQEATHSTTAMLRAWVAYALSPETDRGGAITMQDIPEDYVGLFFGLKKPSAITKEKLEELFEGLIPMLDRLAEEHEHHHDHSFEEITVDAIKKFQEKHTHHPVFASRERGIGEGGSFFGSPLPKAPQGFEWGYLPGAGMVLSRKKKRRSIFG